MTESNLRFALGMGGIDALAQRVAQLAEPFGVFGSMIVQVVKCNAFAADYAWPAVVETAEDGLHLIRDQGGGRPLEPFLLAHAANAHLELGDVRLGRADALAGVDYMRETQSVFDPHCYSVFARAQLELGEPAMDIAFTLDEYAALLERTGFRIYEGELHELRARLAKREGHYAEETAALRLAQDSYMRFGMTAHAARITGSDETYPEA